ncbi:hypothetical protein DZF91_00400 [Actinomadura logoneensis]|uniref:Uncharacterized protein n=1 Tax=Actinomadura logoneensis TaxID=2293572 RepID=A0A372JV13_9ACTN|nr:hypothetical protein [Actinomadura logoneensis]RFU43584.1 hypothetical protein DZF91_00400 [Actinomadura logoneensis]
MGTGLLAGALLVGAVSAWKSDVRVPGERRREEPASSIRPAGMAWTSDFETAPAPSTLFSAEVWRTLRDADDPGSECRHTPGDGYDMWSCLFRTTGRGPRNRDELSLEMTKYDPRLGESAVEHAAAIFDTAHGTYADFPVSAPSPLGDEAFEVPVESTETRKPHLVTFRARNLIVELRVTVYREELDKWELAGERRRQTWLYATELSRGLARLHH